MKSIPILQILSQVGWVHRGNLPDLLQEVRGIGEGHALEIGKDTARALRNNANLFFGPLSNPLKIYTCHHARHVRVVLLQLLFNLLHGLNFIGLLLMELEVLQNFSRRIYTIAGLSEFLSPLLD